MKPDPSPVRGPKNAPDRARCKDQGMGLDIYVGSLSRYLSGDWKTVAAQAAEAEGIAFVTVGPDRESLDAAELVAVVAEWQAAIAAALGGVEPWDDNPDAPYATDQPHWLGYGGLALLAAYAERPDLVSPDDTPEEYAVAPAFQAMQHDPGRFPSLLGGAEWWLPFDGVRATFTAEAPHGHMMAMATLAQLRAELDVLRDAVGATQVDLATALLSGGPDREEVETAAEYRHRWGIFGLAVFAELCAQAEGMQLPLLLDY